MLDTGLEFPSRVEALTTITLQCSPQSGGHKADKSPAYIVYHVYPDIYCSLIFTPLYGISPSPPTKRYLPSPPPPIALRQRLTSLRAPVLPPQTVSPVPLLLPSPKPHCVSSVPHHTASPCPPPHSVSPVPTTQHLPGPHHTASPQSPRCSASS